MRDLLWFFILMFAPQIAVQANEIQYKNLESLSASQQVKIKNWVEHGVSVTRKTLGPLKQAIIPINLAPRYFATEPVPWASVERGKYDGISLHFYRYASQKSLIKDWSLYHELSHLYHPLFDHQDFWLSEGLATYLQNIIMLENGIIDHNDFKQRLMSGLNRGKRQTEQIPGKLRNVAERMWSLGAQQRIYWSGVAFFIEADLLLKKQNKAYSVTRLIREYQSCCKHKSDTAKNFITKLDKLSKSALFSTLYNKYANRKDFPHISTEAINSIRF